MQYSGPLIEKLHSAWSEKELPEWFSTAELKAWIKEKNIKKPNDEDYADSSIDALLSNSVKKETKNKNRKVLIKKTVYTFKTNQ